MRGSARHAPLVLACAVLFAALPALGGERCPGAAQEARFLAQLPRQLRALLPQQTRGLDGIADRGAPYNSTDLVRGDLPRRRFVLAAFAPECAVIAVEYGGIFSSVQLTEYRAFKDGWRAVDRTTLARAPASAAELLSW